MRAQLITDALVIAIWRRGKPDAGGCHPNRVQLILCVHSLKCNGPKHSREWQYERSGVFSASVVEAYRLAVNYVDSILRGAQPADLPVQAPTKYETIFNLKTARSLGIEVSPSLLVRADEVD